MTQCCDVEHTPALFPMNLYSFIVTPENPENPTFLPFILLRKASGKKPCFYFDRNFTNLDHLYIQHRNAECMIPYPETPYVAQGRFLEGRPILVKGFKPESDDACLCLFETSNRAVIIPSSTDHPKPFLQKERDGHWSQLWRIPDGESLLYKDPVIRRSFLVENKSGTTSRGMHILTKTDVRENFADDFVARFGNHRPT